jgi:hypothetical protein
MLYQVRSLRLSNFADLDVLPKYSSYCPMRLWPDSHESASCQFSVFCFVFDKDVTSACQNLFIRTMKTFFNIPLCTFIFNFITQLLIFTVSHAVDEAERHR